jgi:putative transposase
MQACRKLTFDSFTWPDPAGWKIVEHERHKGRLSITNLGLVRMRGKPRAALERGEPRTLTVKHHNGRWHAVISVRYPDAALQRNRAYPDRAVGIDVGCKTLIATSDGDLIENPGHLKRAQTRLKAAQRDLSRKIRKNGWQKYSRRRDKARRKVSRLHELVAARRRDHLHQLSAAICRAFSI